MEKSKQKEFNTLRMKYPAPYSQSWAGLAYPRKFTTDMNASKSIYSQKRKSMIRRSQDMQPQRRYIRQDPTVPHLKYGLFQNPKKAYTSRGQSHILNAKPSVRNSQITEAPLGWKEPKKGRYIKNRTERVNNQDITVDRQFGSRKVEQISKASMEQRDREIRELIERAQSPTASIGRALSRTRRRLAVSASTHLDIKPRAHRQIHGYSRY